MVKKASGQEGKWSKLEKMIVAMIAVIGVYVIAVFGAIVFALFSGININYAVSGEISREAPAKVENSYGAQLHTDER